MQVKLEKIATKFQSVNFNADNYSVGGGLSGHKFASNRHEDARSDNGKVTQGEANQIFKKATGLDTALVNAIINFAVPNMEWHHAGKLPKAYGGGMKKTYFLNSAQIADLAKNWNKYQDSYLAQEQANKSSAEVAKEREAKRQAFLLQNATKKERITSKGIWFYETNREMNGKYGWFSSYGKSYNMTEYYTGWEFPSEEKYQEFLKL
jgi:hypothetical protein